MSIGDLIPANLGVARAMKFAGEAVDETGEDLASLRCFDIDLSTRKGFLPQFLRRRLPQRLFSSPPRHSLLSLLDMYHDVVAYGVATGVERIAIPYTHIFLGSGPDGLCDPRRHDHRDIVVKKRIFAEYGAFIDDRDNLRVCCRGLPDLPKSAMVAWFGRGVFLPLAKEKPVGVVTVRRGEDAETPQLPSSNLWEFIAVNPASLSERKDRRRSPSAISSRSIPPATS